MTILTIAEDKRPIAGLSNDNAGADVAWVGQNGVTEIVPYQESGEYAKVAFFAVKKGDFIFRRVPALQVTVTYQEPQPF